MRLFASLMTGSVLAISVALIAAWAPTTANAESSAAPSAQKPSAKIEAEIRSVMQEHGIPAVSYAVVSSKGVHQAAAFGEARPGVPATTKTMFNTASVTKFLAAEMVLQLADDGALSIDKPMAPTFIDPDVVDDPRAQRLTPRHALAHQTGFPNWRSMADDNKLAFGFEPGERPGYSGEGFNYLARYVSKVTGSSFPELLGKHVLQPAGAKNISFTPEGSFADQFAWSKKPDGSFTEADRQDWSAADDIYASAKDLGMVLSRMLGNGALSPELQKERRTIQFDMVKQFCARPGFSEICPKALGFTLTGIAFEYENEAVYWQGGGDVGERAVVFMVPERDLGVVILANSATGGRVFETIARAYYDNESFTRFLGLQGAQ